jgi:L-histidine N-alpha-methyltransferase
VPEPTFLHLRPEADERAWMAAQVRAGLTAAPMKRIPCACFYDEVGSELFDRITRLPEYYLTRTEDRILSAVVPSLVAALKPHELFEVGSGTGTKIRRFLDAMARAKTLERCTLIDVSAATLEASARSLARDYEGLAVTGLVGDFTRDLARVPPGRRRLGLFLGSTIGNLPHAEQPAFLRALAGTLAPGESFLVGYDLAKDPAVLHAAYNDAEGVTAAFNLNVLRVLNARLGAGFDPAAFEHVAFYDPERSWIEMRLRSKRPQHVRVPGAGLEVDLAAGEEIQTEVSCKHTRAGVEASLAGTGLVLERWLTDADGWFALAQLGLAR